MKVSVETIKGVESGEIAGYAYLVPLLIGLKIKRDLNYKVNPNKYPQMISFEIPFLLEHSEISHIILLQAIDDIESVETNGKTPFYTALKSQLVLACGTNASQGLDAKQLAEIFE